MSVGFVTTTTTIQYLFGATPPSGNTCTMAGWFYDASAPGGGSFWSWMQIGIPTMPVVTGGGQANTQVCTYGAAVGTAATAYVSGSTPAINNGFGAVTYPGWTHIAVTIGGGTLNAYRNGALGFTQAFTGGPAGNWAGLRCGYFLDPALAPDAAARVGFWSRALSQAEVTGLVNGGAPSATNLVAYYPFTGGALTDTSGNGRDMTVLSGSVNDFPSDPAFPSAGFSMSGIVGNYDAGRHRVPSQGRGARRKSRR